MTPPRWQPIDHVAVGSPTDDLIAAVMAVAPASGRCFSSDDGARAVLVPVRSLPPGWLSGAVVHASDELLFLDPPSAAAARSLLAAHGRARSVRIALPHDTRGAGLIKETGRLSVAKAAGPATVLTLYRVPASSAERRARLAAVPRVGESADVVDQRGKWFKAREGTRD